MKKNLVFANRELSWLSFNERVLQEAENPDVPLIERVRFLGIFSNNRDEFFRVRVAAIRRVTKYVKKAEQLLGDDPVALLDKIQKKVVEQQFKFDKLFIRITKELSEEGIFIVNEKQLDKEQGDFVKHFFRENVLPCLVPIMLDNGTKFPYMKDKSVYLIVKLIHPAKKTKYALLEVPTVELSRFVVIPGKDTENYVILIDDVIRYCLNDIFSVLEYNASESYTIKLTRDAELDIDSDVTKSFVEKISKSLKKRSKAQPVRLVYDSEISKDVLQYVVRSIKMGKEDNLIPGGRYHNFKDFMSFPYLGKEHLLYKHPPAIFHPELDIHRSIFDVVKKKMFYSSFPISHILILLIFCAKHPSILKYNLSKLPCIV